MSRTGTFVVPFAARGLASVEAERSLVDQGAVQDQDETRNRIRAPRRSEAQHLVITDVDNTLYDFGAYFEAGLRGMVGAAVESLGRSQEEVIDELRRVFAERGSVEYPFVLADFEQTKGWSRSARHQLIRDGSEAFWASARPALAPYPDVITTLQHLRTQRIAVVAFTDAPIHEAMRRLRGLGLDQYLDGVVATRWFRGRFLRLTELPGFVAPAQRLKIVRPLDDPERKPNPLAYLRIRHSMGFTSDQVTVIGDSIARDLTPAAAVGMRGIWARYGRRDPASEVILQQVVPFKLPEISAPELECDTFPAIDSFESLLDYLPGQLIFHF